MRIFRLPDLGEGLHEADVVEWHVQVGATVAADQPMVSVETAKAVVEIPVPHAGTIEQLFVPAGGTAHVGQPLVGFAGEPEQPDSGTVVGRMQSADPTALPASLPPRTQAGVRAMPAVRALAVKLGVDLARVAPSGAAGLITRADVERAAAGAGDAPAGVPLSGLRKAMARTMAEAHAAVVPVTVVEDADIDGWAAGEHLLARLLRAMVVACGVEPALNAWFDASVSGRQLRTSVDAGIAVDTPDGLLVPVLRDVGTIAATELPARIDGLVDQARRRKTEPVQLRGASITLTNFGAYAGRYATPVVVPPTVAILGAGRARSQVVAVDGAVGVHRVLPLSLTFDHRAVTGGEAARFLAAAVADLQRPA